MLAGLLVLATHVPLGQLVLARGIVFIDIAIAQVAALGVIAGHALLGGETHGLPAQACAAAAALLAAGFLAWTERRAGSAQEAVIGVVYVVAASAQIVLLGFDPHGAEHLKDLLVGQILWVSYGQLIPAALLSALLLAVMVWKRGEPRGLLFYGLFALAITASVQLVGVYLVFASLIVPALGTVSLGRRLGAAYAIGVAGYVSGLVLSALLDLPSGAMIVWTLVGCALLAQVFALGRGRSVAAE